MFRFWHSFVRTVAVVSPFFTLSINVFRRIKVEVNERLWLFTHSLVAPFVGGNRHAPRIHRLFGTFSRRRRRAAKLHRGAVLHGEGEGTNGVRAAVVSTSNLNFELEPRTSSRRDANAFLDLFVWHTFTLFVSRFWTLHVHNFSPRLFPLSANFLSSRREVLEDSWINLRD